MLSIKNLTKDYKVKKGGKVAALKGINIDFADKGLVFLLGKSGSGKSTLLNIIGGLDRYTSGEIVIRGKSSSSFSKSDFDRYRNTFVGFIFQEFHILEDYSVGKNIGLALELQRKKADRATVDGILEAVDLKDYFHRRPNELSGGQKQRVSIARALVKNPDIILADEPTGSLDTNTGRQVFEVLKRLAQNKLVIVVSHDRENAELYADRIIEMKDGNVISDRTWESSDNSSKIETPKDEAGTSGKFADSIIASSDTRENKSTIVELTEGIGASDDIGDNAFSSSELADSIVASSETSDHKNDSAKNADVISALGSLNDDSRPSNNADIPYVDTGRFVETNANNLVLKTYNPKDFKLVRSRLPLGHSIKMGLSGLKLRPIRLFLIVVLLFVSFTLVGFSTTASTINHETIEKNYFKQQNYHNAVVKSAVSIDVGSNVGVGGTLMNDIGGGPLNINIDEKQIDDINKIDGAKVLKVLQNPAREDGIDLGAIGDILGIGTPGTLRLDRHINSNEFATHADDVYYSPYFKGADLLEVDSEKDAGLTLLEGDMPSTPDQVAINDWQAELFQLMGYEEDNGNSAPGVPGIPNIPNIPGLNNFSLDEISPFFSKLLNPDTTPKMQSKPIRTTAYFSNLSKKKPVSPDEYVMTLKQIVGKQIYTPYGTLTISGIVKTDVDKEEIRERFGQVSKDDIIAKMSFGYFDTTAGFAFVSSHFFDNKDVPVANRYNKDEVVVHLDNSKKIDDVYKHLASTKRNINWDELGEDPNEALKEINDNIPGGVSIKIGDLKTLLRAKSSLGAIFDFSSVAIDLVAKVFVVLALIFVIFAALMMFKFISISVQHKKKQIGILRAIGARSWDVFKIFFMEALFIGLLVFGLSVASTIIISQQVNAIVMQYNILPVNLLNPGWITFSVLLGLAIVLSYIATWIPVHGIARKKPIDAINNK